MAGIGTAPEVSASPKAARVRMAAARAELAAAELEAQRALVEFLFALHPDLEYEIREVEGTGLPRLWCDPERFVSELSRVSKIELAQYLDTTVPAALREPRRALTTLCALPRTGEQVRSGRLPVARLWKIQQEYERLPLDTEDQFDALIAAIDPDVEAKKFRMEVADAAASLMDDKRTTAEEHHRSRCAALRNNGDGTGTLSMTGPIHSLAACHRRVQALARAIRKGEDQALAAELPQDTRLADQRTIEQLMYDIYVNTPSSVDARIIKDRETAESHVRINLPTDGDWLARQAGVMVTVPVMTLMGYSNAPGMLNDQSPIPAGLAKLIAGDAGPFFRMLVDPVTGRGLEYPSEHYPFPAAYKRAINHIWRRCAAPGCTRRAETCETDHVDPFDHAHPERGGPTDIVNGIPLCKSHHQAKTQRDIGITKSTTADGAPCVEWSYPTRIATTTVPPRSPADIRQAADLGELAHRYAAEHELRVTARTQDTDDYEDESLPVDVDDAPLPEIEDLLDDADIAELTALARTWATTPDIRKAHVLHLKQNWDGIAWTGDEPWSITDSMDPALVQLAHDREVADLDNDRGPLARCRPYHPEPGERLRIVEGFAGRYPKGEKREPSTIISRWIAKAQAAIDPPPF